MELKREVLAGDLCGSPAQRSPYRPGREPLLGGARMCLELLSAVVTLCKEPPCTRAGRHRREATCCSRRSSAAQHRAKKGLPTEEVWAEGCPVSGDHFPFTLQLSPLQATPPTCFPDCPLSRQTLARGSPALGEKGASKGSRRDEKEGGPRLPAFFLLAHPASPHLPAPSSSALLSPTFLLPKACSGLLEGEPADS